MTPTPLESLRSGLVSTFDEGERLDLENCGHVRRFPRRQSLFTEGDSSDWVAVVLSGRIQIEALTDDGRRLELNRVFPGDLLGELSALDGAPRSGSAIALDPVEVLAVPAAAFRGWLLQHPRVALLLLELLVGKIRAADRRRVDLVARDAATRVCQRLLELAPVEDGDGVGVSVTHDELAAWVGTSREAVSKAMGRLRRAGYIETGRRAVILTDRGALQRLAR